MTRQPVGILVRDVMTCRTSPSRSRTVRTSRTPKPTDSAGGAPPGGAMEERRIFVVPKSDFEIVDVWHVSGLKATGSQDIVVKDAFVPAYRTVTFADNFRGVAPGHATNSMRTA